MRNKPLKLVSLLMIVAMMVTPLRGLFADETINMGHVTQDQVAVMDMHDSMASGGISESCDQCDMQQCCQGSSCNSGHCFSCMAIMPLNFEQSLSQLNHNNQFIYTVSSISFQISPLLQPPRA